MALKAKTRSVAPSDHPAPIAVGPEEELVRIRGWHANAITGQRRIVFVAGEPGIGKSTFVHAFLNSIAREHDVQLGRAMRRAIRRGGTVHAVTGNLLLVLFLELQYYRRAQC